MDSADIKVVYYDIEVLQKRSKTIISRELIHNSFNDNEIIVLNNKKDLSDFIEDINSENYVLLLMSSGSFSSVDFLSLINR
jgi:UDP-N-acetylmuramate--alanine ligase/UDP-N-acetylmuramate: L-alanyl-gamma-D-glutamyl-meso-diaminopimelate ligase